MSAGLTLTLLFAVAVATYVFMPLVRRDAFAAAGVRSEALSRSRELQSRHEMILTSLRDLEEDMQTDKLSPEDYAQLKSKLTNQAVATLKDLDGAELERNRPPQRGPRSVKDK